MQEALRLVDGMSDVAAGTRLGVSPESVRLWRIKGANKVSAPVREKLTAAVERGPAPSVAELLADHQRELAELARAYTRRIVRAVAGDIDAALSLPTPAATGALPPPPAPRRKAAEG